jgi:uncharacterized membrane protein
MMQWGNGGIHGFAGGGSGWFHPLMLFAWIIPVVLLITLIWLLVDSNRRRHHVALVGPAVPLAGAVDAGVPTTLVSAVVPSPALSILDERYARGEIDREEYLARRKDLGG